MRPKTFSGNRPVASKTASPYNTSLWRRERKAFLLEHMSCVRCKYAIATIVDHKVRWRGSADEYRLFWDKRNWQSLCKRCHDQWKQQNERGHINHQLHETDRTGMPKDARHHWNQD